MKTFAIISFISTKNKDVTFSEINDFFKDSASSIRASLKTLVSQKIIIKKNIGKNNYEYHLKENPYLNKNTLDKIHFDTQAILNFLKTIQDTEEEDFQDVEEDIVLQEKEVIIQEVKEEFLNEKAEQYFKEDKISIALQISSYFAEQSRQEIKDKNIAEFILQYLNNGFSSEDIKNAIDKYIKSFKESNRKWNTILTPREFFEKVLIEVL